MKQLFLILVLVIGVCAKNAITKPENTQTKKAHFLRGIGRMNSMAELKPCPWCSEKTFVCVVTEQEFGTDFYYVYCHICGARGPYNVDRQIAIEAWNKRK